MWPAGVWWWMVAAVTVAVLGVPTSAVAAGQCGVPADPGWSPTEHAIWRQLCAGSWAALHPAGADADPAEDAGWGPDQVVSSAFIEQVLTMPYAAAIDRHGIRLDGAWLRDGLTLDEATVPFPLRCHKCRIAGLRADDAVIEGTLDLGGSAVLGNVNLQRASIEGDLTVNDGAAVAGTVLADGLTVTGDALLGSAHLTELNLRVATIGGQFAVYDGAVVDGDLNADGITVADSVFLTSGAEFGDVVLTDGAIGGLEIGDGSRVSGTLYADGLEVTHGVHMNRGSRFGSVVLLGAHVGGNVELSDGTVVSGELNANRLTVGQSIVMISGSRFADINLAGADVGGHVEISDHTVVSGMLKADGISVGEGMLLTNTSRFADVRLIGADVGGEIDFSGRSVVSGPVTAERLRVADNLFLRSGSFSDFNLVGADISGVIALNGARWTPGSVLDLRLAHAGGISTDDRAASWPPAIRLNDFTFEQWAEPSPTVLGSAWFVHTWLARLDGFSAGPYNQLADVMDAAGHPTIATDIRYERSQAERRRVTGDHPDRWGRQLHWLVLGYGFRPWWALPWCVAVWAVGFVLLWSGVALHLRRRDAGPAAPEAGSGRRRSTGGAFGRIHLVRTARWPAGRAAVYSLDCLLPAIKLVSADDLPPRNRLQETWLIGQQLLGWLLTLFIVGWLSGLLVQA